MSIELLAKLVIAGVLLFAGVALSLKARSHPESSLGWAARMSAIGLAAVVYLQCLTDRFDCRGPIDFALRWMAREGKGIAESCMSLF